MNLETYTRRCLKELRFKPRRQRGQNFLVNESVQESLVRSASLSPEDIVVEVGAGLGTLTSRLAREAKLVYTFEIEEFFYRHLENAFESFENIRLLRKSFNAYSLGELIESIERDLAGKKVKIVANLPYQITSLFFNAVIEYADWIELASVMIQREVAERLSAEPGGRAYGSFTIFVQTYYDVDLFLFVPSSDFIPAPRVESALVLITPQGEDERRRFEESGTFFRLVEEVFKHRRKTLINALVRAYPSLPRAALSQCLKDAGLDPKVRPEKLGRMEYLSLASGIDEQMEEKRTEAKRSEEL